MFPSNRNAPRHTPPPTPPTRPPQSLPTGLSACVRSTIPPFNCLSLGLTFIIVPSGAFSFSFRRLENLFLNLCSCPRDGPTPPPPSHEPVRGMGHPLHASADLPSPRPLQPETVHDSLLAEPQTDTSVLRHVIFPPQCLDPCVESLRVRPLHSPNGGGGFHRFQRRQKTTFTHSQFIS